MQLPWAARQGRNKVNNSSAVAILSAKALVQPNGTINTTILNIVRCSFEGNGLAIQMVDPIV